jgi:hypothetical protein
MRRLFLAALAALLAQSLAALSIEVSSSAGYAESLVPSVGWRQAVVGRQLPEGSVVAAWKGARAEMDYLGSRISLGSLGHLEVLSIGPESVGLRLTEGSLSVTAAGLRFTIEYRGFRISLEGGELSLADGILAVASGSVAVEGYSSRPLALATGSRLDLLARVTGPVLGD